MRLMESPHIVNDGFDPSAIRVLKAWMDDIDPEALAFARKRFMESHPQVESDGWSDERFLDEMGLKKDGVLTHAAMILLGKEESRHKMRFEPWMRWILRDGDNAVLDSELFYPPFFALCREDVRDGQESDAERVRSLASARGSVQLHLPSELSQERVHHAHGV